MNDYFEITKKYFLQELEYGHVQEDEADEFSCRAIYPCLIESGITEEEHKRFKRYSYRDSMVRSVLVYEATLWFLDDENFRKNVIKHLKEQVKHIKEESENDI